MIATKQQCDNVNNRVDNVKDVHVTMELWRPRDRDSSIINEHTRAPASPGKFINKNLNLNLCCVPSWYIKLAMYL